MEELIKRLNDEDKKAYKAIISMWFEKFKEHLCKHSITDFEKANNYFDRLYGFFYGLTMCDYITIEEQFNLEKELYDIMKKADIEY